MLPRPGSNKPYSRTNGTVKRISIDDFNILTRLGQGGFGTVYLAIKKYNNKEYAIKVVKKKLFKSALRVKDAINEKNIMVKASNPFVIKLHYAFQDDRRIYYVMEYINGGVLLTYLRYMKRFNEKTTRFYAAQIALALKYLHEEKDVVYRDLKPENILVDETGYVRLSDFGLSAMGVERLNSVCGTYEYIAPEILRGKEYTKVIDYFSFGCLIYEMLHGYSPFAEKTHATENRSIIRSIVEGKYSIDAKLSISPEAQDLISKLLALDPDQRLGTNGVQEIQDHPFFDKINWSNLYKKKIQCPITVIRYPGVVEKKNKLTESFQESSLNIVVSGFDYDADHEAESQLSY